MNTTADRTIVLALADVALARGLASSVAWRPGSTWLYLGQDIRLAMEMERAIGSALGRHRSGDRLQEIAASLRQEYIDFIGGLAPSRPSPGWWFTSVSEKNPFITTVFLSACYLSLCREYVAGSPADALVLCESAPLMEALSLALGDIPGIEVQNHYPARLRAHDALRAGMEKAGAWAWFLIRFSTRILLSRLFGLLRRSRRAGQGTRERVLIHSWADARAFRERETYTDTYFGTLGRDLGRRGHPCGYLVTVLPTLWYPRALFGLRRYPEDLFLFEEFTRVRDLLPALRAPGGAGADLPPRMALAGMDLSPVIRAELAADGRGTRAAQSFLAYLAARRIPRAFPVQAFIYTFENHVWEKMFCLGLREATPGTRLVGYAHSIVSPMYLSYSLSRAELGKVPLPDRIAVNGPRARENLVASGFPGEMVVVTGSFRYPDFRQVKTRPGKKPGRHVLVPLAAGMDESLELALKSVQALGTVPGVSITLKPHPSISRETLLSSLPGLPASVEVRTDPVDRLLDKADLVLFSSTTVAVEALGRGIPLLHVKSELDIDRNILEGLPMVPSAGDLAKIREIALQILEDPSRFAAGGRAAVGEFFTPSGEGSVDLLLGDRA